MYIMQNTSSFCSCKHPRGYFDETGCLQKHNELFLMHYKYKYNQIYFIFLYSFFKTLQHYFKYDKNLVKKLVKPVAGTFKSLSFLTMFLAILSIAFDAFALGNKTEKGC